MDQQEHTFKLVDWTRNAPETKLGAGGWGGARRGEALSALSPAIMHTRVFGLTGGP